MPHVISIRRIIARNIAYPARRAVFSRRAPTHPLRLEIRWRLRIFVTVFYFFVKSIKIKLRIKFETFKYSISILEFISYIKGGLKTEIIKQFLISISSNVDRISMYI